MFRYTPEDRAAIGRYACKHGVKAASTYFSRKLGKKINKSSVHSMKVAYLESVRRKRRADEEIAELHPKKRGRPLLLGNQVDDQVQLYLKKLREQGGVVSASVVVAATRGILVSIDRTQLVKFGVHIELSKQ